MKALMIVSLILSVGLNLKAKQKSKLNAPATTEWKETLAPVGDTPFLINDNEFYKQSLVEAKAVERKPAQAKEDGQSYSEPEFPADFQDLRAKLVGGTDSKGVVHQAISTVEALDSAINLNTKPTFYNSLTPSAKLVVLQLKALKPFRSFIFRAKKYVEKNSATRSLIVSLLNAQLAGIQMLFPVGGNVSVNQWEIIFNYITRPTPDLDYMINEDIQLHQSYTEIAHDLDKVIIDFEQLIASSSAPIWWDNKLYMAFANMVSRPDRYVKLGKPELYAMLSASSLGLSFLYSTSAYSFNGLKSAIDKLGNLFGIGVLTNLGFGGIDVDKIFDLVSYSALKRDMEDKRLASMRFTAKGADGINSFVRTGILNAHPDLFQIVGGGHGEKAMKRAYELLAASARTAKVAFEGTKNRKPSNDPENDFLFDSRIAQAFDRIGTLSLQNLNLLIRGMREVRSNEKVTCDGNYTALSEKDSPTSALVSTDNIIRMNIKAFYCNPPRHLNELYAQDWDTEKKYIDVRVKNASTSSNYTVRNYKYGMATKWRYDAYHKIFPDIKPLEERIKRYGEQVQVTEDVPKHARLLMQSWGGAAFMLPIGAVIF